MTAAVEWKRTGLSTGCNSPHGNASILCFRRVTSTTNNDRIERIFFNIHYLDFEEDFFFFKEKGNGMHYFSPKVQAGLHKVL